MNSCKFLGNLTRDPELKKTPTGTSVVSFGLAVSRSFKRGDEKAKETAFLDMEAWDSGAELIAQNFKKGSKILVDASVKQENWDDKATGAKRSKLKFRVNQFYFVDSNPNRAPRDEAAPAPDNGGDAGGSGDGDIPF